MIAVIMSFLKKKMHFFWPYFGTFSIKSTTKGSQRRLLRSKHWNKDMNAFLWVCRRPQGASLLGLKSQFRSLTAGLYSASLGSKNPVRHKPSLIRPRSCAPRGAFFSKMHQNYSYGTKEARCAIRYEQLSRYWGIQVLNGCTCTDFQGP